MPFTLPGKRNTVGKQIEEHLLDKKKSISSSSASAISETALKLITAEGIAIGQAVGIDSNGNAVIAGSVPAVGVAKTTVNSGSSVIIQVDKLITVPNAGFAANNRVFVKNADPNLSTNLPDITLDTFVQCLGYAISTDEMIIEYHNPVYIE